MSINCYSGRFDQYDDELVMIHFFTILLEQFDCDNAMLTFEDRTKAGLPCKPHYHFVFQSPEPSREKIRKFISKNPELKGTFSSLKVIELEEYSRAICYILKQYPIQQYVPYTEYGPVQMDEFIKISQAYNEKLVLNSFKEHIDYFILLTMDKYDIKPPLIKWGNTEPDRKQIFEDLYRYVYKWNNNSENKNKPIILPSNIKPTIVFIESKILCEDTFIERAFLDNSSLIYEHHIKESSYNYKTNTTITKISGFMPDSFYEKSEEEDIFLSQPYDKPIAQI